MSEEKKNNEGKGDNEDKESEHKLPQEKQTQGEKHNEHRIGHHAHHNEHNEPHKASSQKKPSINYTRIIIGLAVILFIILFLNISLTANINSIISKKVKDTEEKLRPAEIDIAVITDKSCKDCFDVSSIISNIPSSKVGKQKNLDFSSDEAKSLISNHNIGKVPAVIITGEINKLSLQQFTKAGNALILADVPPPYINAVTGKAEGFVTAYAIADASCDKCIDINSLIQQLENGGIKFREKKSLKPDSAEAKSLLSKYAIDAIPALILSKDASAYTLINQAWIQIGTKEADGSFVVRNINPPYINTTTNKIVGLVDATYLTDKSCDKCYNVTEHKLILENPSGLNIALNNEKTFDVGSKEGKALLEKYDIKLVPTIILSKDILAYPAVNAIRRFFSAKDDGSFVFTELDAMGAYKDLENNEIIYPKSG